MPLTCLDTLVGLSNRNDACFTTDRPAEYNTSNSGYYLTDREYGFPLNGALFANIMGGESNIWDMLAEAKSQAIRDVKDDIRAGLTEVRKKRVISWTGRMGSVDIEDTNTYNTVSEAVLGIQIEPQRLRYASFIVKAVWLAVDTTGTITVNFSSNDSSFSGTSADVNAVAGQFVRKALDSALELPFFSLYQDDLKYNVYYNRGSVKPVWNKVFDTEHIKNPWVAHLAASGFSLDAIDNNYDASGNDAFGLAIEGYFQTYPLDWICDLLEKGGEDFLQIIARLIQLKGAVKLISMILDSDRINYYTVLQPEALFGKRRGLMNLYGELLIKLVNEVPAEILEVYGGKKQDPEVMSIIL